MTYEQFKVAMKAKFTFDDEEGFVAARPGQRLVFEQDGGRLLRLTMFNEIPIEDSERHFAASAILDAPATDEVVHVTEPGPYFDHLYWNCHEEGLYSIDCIEDLEDDLDLEAYAGLSKAERIASMPFFQNPLATSLEAFFARIRVVEAS
ncbi:MAG: hypothetical protein ABMB14_14035 [Myxococcota bacterium]